MKPKTIAILGKLNGWRLYSQTKLQDIDRELLSADHSLHFEHPEIHSAVVRCQASIQGLFDTLAGIYEAEETSRDNCWNESPTELETEQLMALTRFLWGIDPFLRSTADDARARLEVKLADQNDPMCDYEIEATIDFILRKDDPEHDENDDNILSTRDAILTYPRKDENSGHDEIVEPGGLQAEIHHWQLHDLYLHDYVSDFPYLSLRDCLRIGEIDIDVRICQQYSFAVR